MKKQLSFMAFVSGVLMGLSVILPEMFGFIAWVALLPLFLTLLPMGERVMPKARRFFLAGFLFYFGYGLTYFHWFWALFPLDFTGLSDGESIVVILLAWAGLSALYAILGGLLFLLPALLYRLGAFRRSPVCAVIVYPALFVLYEFILTLDWWGVPWGKIAIGQTYFLPILQTASLFGSYFIAGLIVFVNVSLAFLICHKGKALLRTLPFAIAVIAFVLNMATGIFLYQTAPVCEKMHKR